MKNAGVKVLVWLLTLHISLGAAWGQEATLEWPVPQVASTIRLGNMQLHLTEQARRDVQADVDALYRSPRFFQLKAEKVDMYLPIIEPILAEYNVPNEFKYLVIQESGLVPDAVSSSNAVGYWQFKEASATELGMRVDRQIDDRMNIVDATVGAMKYLLRSNEVFDNWVYSLLSYNIGLGGATRSLDDKYYGARQYRIDHNTHWYVKKFLSHLVAFEGALGRVPRQVMLYQYNNTMGKSLRQIGQEFAMPEEEISAYNKWLKTNRIPDDKQYTVIVPLKLDDSQELQLASQNTPAKKQALEELQFGRLQSGPAEVAISNTGERVFQEINGLRATVARPDDKITVLAKAGDVSVYNFIKWNDISPATKIQPGQVYYFKKKKNRATVYKHTTQPGQTLWQIAQQYGIKEKKLRQKNRMAKAEEPEAGRILWLRYIRPNNQEAEYDEAVRQRAAEAAAKPAAPTVTVSNNQLAAELSRRTSDPVASTTTMALSRPVTVADTPRVEVNKPVPVNSSPVQPPASVNTQQLFPENSGAARNVQTQIEEKSPADSLVFYSEEAAFGTAGAEVFADEPGTAEPAAAPVANPTEPGPSSPVAQPTPKTHTVVAGETLYAISRAYGLSVAELRSLNNLSERDPISIGQVLLLEAKQQPDADDEDTQIATTTGETSPATASEPVAEGTVVYHIVAEGETMYRVARRYNVTIKDIMEWNQREDFNIKPGERLMVKPAN